MVESRRISWAGIGVGGEGREMCIHGFGGETGHIGLHGRLANGYEHKNGIHFEEVGWGVGVMNWVCPT